MSSVDVVNSIDVTVSLSTVVAQSVTRSAVDEVLGISEAGSATKYLNEQGNWATPSGGVGSVNWGGIGGTLSNQTDLNTALNARELLSNKVTTLTGNTASNTVYATVKAMFDYYKYERCLYQTTAEVTVTATSAETIVDSILIAANSLAANDLIQVYSRLLKTATALANFRLSINTSSALGGTALGLANPSAGQRYVGFERHIACKAAGLIEVYSALTSQATDEIIANQTETTATIDYKVDNYLILSIQGNIADTFRRSYTQMKIQRASI